MTERPILFSAPMVRAILDGRKTQTRRIVKPQPTITALDDGRYDAAWGGRFALGCSTPGECLSPWSPYGQPGDRLWVRETWWQDRRDQLVAVMDVDGYTIDKHQASNATGCHVGDMAGLRANQFWRKRPSIHMPRWASRILLEIVAIRVERLNDISEVDAEAEGCTADLCDGPTFYDDFASLWRRINGPDSWAANPWVWVISFKRVTP